MPKMESKGRDKISTLAKFLFCFFLSWGFNLQCFENFLRQVELYNILQLQEVGHVEYWTFTQNNSFFFSQLI